MILATIIGNIGKDAETKQINGKDYISFSVASTEKNGEQETTTWVSVLTSHNPNLLPHLKKGQQVFIQGRMKAGIYQTQQSVGIYLSVFAQTLQLCGGKREEQATVPAGSPAVQSQTPTVASVAEAQQPPTPFPPAEEETKDDLLPF